MNNHFFQSSYQQVCPCALLWTPKDTDGIAIFLFSDRYIFSDESPDLGCFFVCQSSAPWTKHLRDPLKSFALWNVSSSRPNPAQENVLVAGGSALRCRVLSQLLSNPFFKIKSTLQKYSSSSRCCSQDPSLRACPGSCPPREPPSKAESSQAYRPTPRDLPGLEAPSPAHLPTSVGLIFCVGSSSKWLSTQHKTQMPSTSSLQGILLVTEFHPTWLPSLTIHIPSVTDAHLGVTAPTPLHAGRSGSGLHDMCPSPTCLILPAQASRALPSQNNPSNTWVHLSQCPDSPLLQAAHSLFLPSLPLRCSPKNTAFKIVCLGKKFRAASSPLSLPHQLLVNYCRWTLLRPKQGKLRFSKRQADTHFLGLDGL